VEAKQRVRERIWRTLEKEGAARFPGARGRIPNFRGAEAAAERLGDLPEWQAAAVVKSNPDAPQLPVRRRALRDGKTLYMAVPRLGEDKPFVRVAGDPTIRKALAEGAPARVEDLGHVDVVVCGAVAVNHAGVRVGKGGGYSDLELPDTTHDFHVDIVVTPDDVLRTHARRRSPGVIWEHLDDDMIEAIPALAARRPRRRSPAS
jgi:5-formyltetrahydrofolate cyclo-ligase